MRSERIDHGCGCVFRFFSALFCTFFMKYLLLIFMATSVFAINVLHNEYPSLKQRFFSRFVLPVCVKISEDIISTCDKNKILKCCWWHTIHYIRTAGLLLLMTWVRV